MQAHIHKLKFELGLNELLFEQRLRHNFYADFA